MTKLQIFCGVLCFGVTVSVMTKGRDIAPPDRAKAVCRGEIKKRLKDPDSAEFGQSLAQQNDAGGWIVYRELTAKNSFGATVKSTLVCTLMPDLSVVSVAPLDPSRK